MGYAVNLIRYYEFLVPKGFSRRTLHLLSVDNLRKLANDYGYKEGGRQC
jgi:hypothetical protein